MPEKVLFIDRDGTLIHEPNDYQVDALDKVHLVDAVIPSLLELANHGYRFVMITNQDGLGTESFPQEDFDPPHALTMSLFESQGIRFDEIFICPHLPDDGCECRKPLPGLLGDFFERVDVDRKQSLVVGDRDTDLGFARNINVPGYLVDPEDADSWNQIVRQVLDLSLIHISEPTRH